MLLTVCQVCLSKDEIKTQFLRSLLSLTMAVSMSKCSSRGQSLAHFLQRGAD